MTQNKICYLCACIFALWFSGCTMLYRTTYNIFNAQPATRRTKVTFQVIDPEGNPINNATIHAGFGDPFYIQNEYKYHKLKTNRKGVVSCTTHTDGYLRFWVESSGFYDCKSYETNIWTQTSNDKSYFELNIIMKPIHDPVPMITGLNYTGYDIPDLGKYYGFDLEYGSLVEPLGTGKTADFFMRQDGFRDDETGVLFWCIEFAVTNRLDGFIPFKLDEKSRFQTPYEAPENGYTNKFVWGYLEQQKRSFIIGPYEGMTNEVPYSPARRFLSLSYNDGVFFRVRGSLSENDKHTSKYGCLLPPLNGAFGHKNFISFRHRINMNGTRNIEPGERLNPVQPVRSEF